MQFPSHAPQSGGWFKFIVGTLVWTVLCAVALESGAPPYLAAIVWAIGFVFIAGAAGTSVREAFDLVKVWVLSIAAIAAVGLGLAFLVPL